MRVRNLSTVVKVAVQKDKACVINIQPDSNCALGSSVGRCQLIGRSCDVSKSSLHSFLREEQHELATHVECPHKLILFVWRANCQTFQHQLLPESLFGLIASIEVSLRDHLLEAYDEDVCFIAYVRKEPLFEINRLQGSVA